MAHTNKALIALVAGMGVIILLGFGVLIAGLIFKASAPEMVTPEGDERKSGHKKILKSVTSQFDRINLPAGHRIENIGLSDTQIIIHTSQTSGAGGVFIINSETGIIHRQFDIGTAP